MSGHLILISGIAGAGKSTLTQQALRYLPDLEYLTTYTTRPPRPLEYTRHEYQFVDRSTYRRLQAASVDWDHTEYGNEWYGADVAAVTDRLACHDMICAVAPSPPIIAMMRNRYNGTIHFLWLDVSPAVAAKRISGDRKRRARPEDSELVAQAEVIFTPTGQLVLDGPAFASCLLQIMLEG